MKKIMFAGSFDPITNAHLDIIKRLNELGFYIFIGIFVNSNKNYMFDIDKRIDMIKEVIKENNLLNIETFSSDKLLSDVCKEKDITLVARGLRNIIDYEYEKNMEINNKKINSSLEYIYLNSNKENEHLSSTVVRELLSYKKDISNLVPISVNNYINKKGKM